MSPCLSSLAGLLWLGPILHAAEPQLLDETLLSRLREEASHNHPSALAGKARAAAAAHEAHGVRQWEDPTLAFGLTGASRMMRQSDGDVSIGIEQTLPKPGLSAAKQSRMAAMSRAEEENSAASGIAAASLAAESAIRLALADETVSLQLEQVAWAQTQAETASRMAADPMSGATDALRMKTELARELQFLDNARRERRAEATQLNLVLGRPPEADWPELRLPAKPLPVPIAAAEVARISHANPKVRAMKEMAVAAREEVRIAERERLPQASVGLETQLDSDSGKSRSTTLGIKLNLPWFNDPVYRSVGYAARARETATMAEIESTRREVAARVISAVTTAANSAAQARAYADQIQPSAIAARNSAEAAWISSKAPLSSLIDAARLVATIRLEQRRMVASQLSALEELRTLVPSPNLP